MIFPNLASVLNKTNKEQYIFTCKLQHSILIKNKTKWYYSNCSWNSNATSCGMPITKLQTLNINYAQSQNSSGAKPRGSVCFMNYTVRLDLRLCHHEVQTEQADGEVLHHH
jgi:hypothetical protein